VNPTRTYKRDTWNVICKRANETVTSDDTLSNDSELLFYMAANTTYRFRLTVFYKTAAAADFKYAVDCPASPTQAAIRQSHVVPNSTNNTNFAVQETEVGSTSVVSAVTTPGYIVIDGLWQNGANAGNLAFQWAQNTSDVGSTTVLKGSTLEYMVN
jgi:hypothetical protein